MITSSNIQGKSTIIIKIHKLGGSITQNSGLGPQGGKLPTQPPKRPKAMTIVVLILSALVIILGVTTFLAVRQIIPGPKAPPQPSSTVPVTPTPTATSSTGFATNTPVAMATVASGTITENLLLTCGTNCNDPIRVTITTIQVNDADGNMTWNISLKNVTGTSIAYQVNTFELRTNANQTQIPATISQSYGNLLNGDPYSIQGIFAFVPTQNTTYTLTAVVSEYAVTQINFEPTQITNL